ARRLHGRADPRTGGRGARGARRARRRRRRRVHRRRPPRRRRRRHAARAPVQRGHRPHDRRALRGADADARRPCPRRRGRGRARAGRLAVARREPDGRPRRRPRRRHRAAGASDAPVGARVGRAPAPRAVARRARHRRGDAAPPLPHRRGDPHPRSQPEDEPAAPDRRRPRSAPRRGARRGDRRDRNRPRAARAGGEGRAVRVGAVRGARARDRLLGALHVSRRAGPASARDAAAAAVRGPRRDLRARTAPRRRRGAGEPDARRPRSRLAREGDEAALALRQLLAPRQAPPRARRPDRRRGPRGVRAVSRGSLMLEDGTVFEGESVGAAGPAFGEAVFTTSMTGYQEVATDPSFEGQIVCFTAPMVGNYGVDEHRSESRRAHAKAVVMRDARGPEWTDWLCEHGLVALTGVDTRSLVLHLRERGAMRAAAVAGDADLDETLAAVRAQPQMAGAALVAGGSTREAYTFAAEGAVRVAVVDYGCKRSILRRVAAAGAAVDVFPHGVDADTLAGYDGVVLSPGPGDPAPLGGEARTVEELLGRTPVLGVCLGHQLLAVATGKQTFKLPFGH